MYGNTINITNIININIKLLYKSCFFFFRIANIKKLENFLIYKYCIVYLFRMMLITLYQLFFYSYIFMRRIEYQFVIICYIKVDQLFVVMHFTYNLIAWLKKILPYSRRIKNLYLITNCIIWIRILHVFSLDILVEEIANLVTNFRGD